MNDEIYNTNSANNQQNWLQRNAEWLLPIGGAAANIGYNIYANQQNNKFNAKQAELNRQFNAAEAEKARQFETEMSNTAVTRAMQDYKNAGMNPHLATGGGPASTPSGSAASGSAAATTGMMPMDVGTAMNTALTHAQLSNIEADTAMKNKQSGKTKKETEYIENKIGLENALNEVQVQLAQAQTKDAQEAAMQKRQMVINQMIQNYYEFETGQKMPSDLSGAIAGHIAHALGNEKGTSDSADLIYQLMKEEVEKYKGNKRNK